MKKRHRRKIRTIPARLCAAPLGYPFLAAVLGLVFFAGACALTARAGADRLPDGYWLESKSREILDKTITLHLDPDLSSLGAGERRAAEKIIQAGRIFNAIYENSRHRRATDARERLIELDGKLGSPVTTQNLLKLYYLFKGPIARTLDNAYVPFLPVENKVPGKNVYPWGVTKEELDRFLGEHPEERSRILHVRTVVRRSERPVIEMDLASLDKYPVLEVLHPGLREELDALREAPGSKAFYSVPYSVVYAEELLKAYQLLMEAAEAVEEDDVEFARYLRHRARDLLANDYEAGDAAWVTGQFEHLNAQIGSYEVYDDELYSVKSFFGLVLMIKDEEKTTALRSAIQGLQDFEDSLPYDPQGSTGGNKKRVRENIPVGVYHIIADFGQSRGTNTATILPNESYITRKYGRTILMRYNILTNPDLYDIRKEAFQSAVAGAFHGDFDSKGNFYRTLWHEIGHYLGPDLTRDGRTVEEALLETFSTMEELKADLISLFLARALHSRSYFDDQELKGVYASGVRRVLLKNQPRRSQPYQTMELMQFNYYLEHGLLEFDEKTQKLVIHYENYHDVVSSMLRKVLAIQYEGNKAGADRFIDDYSIWENKIHGRIARAMQKTERYRYAIVNYGILDE